MPIRRASHSSNRFGIIAVTVCCHVGLQRTTYDLGSALEAAEGSISGRKTDPSIASTTAMSSD